MGVNAGGIVEEEGVLQGDGLTFHSLHLGHEGDPPGPVSKSAELHDDVDRGDDPLLARSHAPRQGASVTGATHV